MLSKHRIVSSKFPWDLILLLLKYLQDVVDGTQTADTLDSVESDNNQVKARIDPNASKVQ